MMQIWNWFSLEFAVNSYIAVTVKRHAKIGVDLITIGCMDRLRFSGIR